MSTNAKCHYCGGERFETQTMRYLYSRGEKSLLVPEMPAEVCQTCGMIFYDGAALLKVEERFHAIHDRAEQPDRYLTLPVYEYA